MASSSIQIHGFTITTFATSRETPKFTSSNSLFFGSTRTGKCGRLTATTLKGRRTGPVRAVAEKVSAVDEVGKMVIEKMVNDAERFAKEEKEKRNSIYAKKHADSVVYKTENQLKNVGENVPPSVRDKVEAKLGALKDATSSGVTETIKDAITALNEELMQMSSQLSSSSSSSAAAEVKVTAKNMHVSVFKARRVLEQIRGRSYEDALMILELMPYRASYPILKLVYSAAANGTHNLDLKESDAYIKRAEANDGPFVKKMRPRARGRGSAIKNLTSHITVVMGWRNT